MKANPLVIGIDPGTYAMGYGIITQRGSHLEHIHSGALVAKRTLPLHERLLALHQALWKIIDEYHPSHASVEGVFAHKNVQSTVTLAHARGIALLACAQRGIDVVEYSPTQVKTAAVGHGRASKEQVMRMMQRLFPRSLGHDRFDGYDALAVAFCHLQFLKTGDRIRSQVRA